MLAGQTKLYAKISHRLKRKKGGKYLAGKAPQRYAVQESDTTMLPIAFLLVNKILLAFK